MKKTLALLSVVALSLPLFAQEPQTAHDYEVYKQLNIFNNLYRELDLYYVDSLEADKVIGDAITGMLDMVDPYTEYYTSERTEELRQMTTGKYAGIGSVISVNRHARRCIIAEPYAGMPAAEAGLRVGDIILAQDGKDYGLSEEGREGEYSSRVSQSLRGEPGTTFSLTVKRYGVEDPLTFRITRRIIQLPSVAYSGMLPGDSVGYVRLESYTEQSTRELSVAISALKRKGARALVLDLRENPGGLLEQAVRITNLFIPKGREVVNLRGKNAEDGTSYKTVAEPLDTEMPLAVLVSSGTASAAEITSGALQDYDRAVIVGQRTYGKGLVQQPHALPTGAVLKLTTAKYYIPSGRCIQAYSYADGQPRHLPDSLARAFKTASGRIVYDGGGIKPDVEVQPDSLPTLLSYLSASEALTDYLSYYRQQHDSIAPPEEFSLAEEEYEEFKAFLKKNDFTYDNQSANALSVLERIAAAEGYADVTREEFAALRAKLSHSFDHDFSYWEPQIRILVESRIVGLYYYQAGQIAYALRADKDLEAALAALCHQN